MARPLSSELIAEVHPPHAAPPRPTSVEEIQQQVAERFGISRAELIGSSRAATPLRARQVAIFLTRELTDLSLPQIGRLYGGRDHSTVLNSLRRVEAGLDEDAELAERVQELRGAIHNPAARTSADGRRHCKNQRLSHRRFHRPKSACRRRITPRSRLFPQDLTQLKKASDHLKLTTKREELVSKLSIVSRAVSTRAATQALSGVLAHRRRGTRDAFGHRPRPRPARPTLEADGRGRGLGPAARPAAGRSRPLAGRRHASRSRRARPSATSRSAAAAPASTCGCCRPRTSRSCRRPEGEPSLKIPAQALGGEHRPGRPRRLARRHAPGPDRRLRRRRGHGDDDGRHRLLPAGGQADRAGERRSAARSRRTSRPGRCASWAASSPRRASRRRRSRCSPTRPSSQAGSITLTTRLIDGQFPNFRQLLPESYEHDVRLPRIGVPRRHPPGQPAGAAQRAAAALLRARAS